MRRVPFVVDAHTGAFLNPRWKYLQWLQYFYCRQAAGTIVTNEHLAKQIEDRGGTVVIVRDVPIEYEPTPEAYPRGDGFTVAYISSFDIDEPIEEFLSAARRLPHVAFHVTGDVQLLDRSLLQTTPRNVKFTGFLPNGAYGSLLRTADAVLCLTKQDHAMLRGGYEAIYQGTPVIVSNWDILRRSFDEGAVHVENDAAAIADGIEKMRTGLETVQARRHQLEKQEDG